MDRRALVFLTLLASAGFAGAQPNDPASPTPAPPEQNRDDKPRRHFDNGGRGPRDGEVPDQWKKRLERLPEEEREQFKKNWEKWKKLSPEEREKLRDKDPHGFKRKIIKEAVDEAIRDTGLALSEDQKEVFSLRYMQERRKLEQELREEMEEKRRQRLPALIEKLKQEFSAQPQAPSPVPAASPSPASTAGSGS